MDPITIAMIGAPIATDLLSQFLSKGDREAEKKLREEALAVYGDASPPTLERMLRERLGPSAMEAIPSDFGNKQARDAALQQLVAMGSQGGMDAGSQLAVEGARRAAAAQEAQGRGAVRQEFQRRGMGGAGEAILALQAQQAGSDRAALSDMQAAGDARSRALQALATGGGMASQAEGQDFERAARIAASKDAIARFNSELATDALQRQYTNDLALRDRRYGALTSAADQHDRDADRTRQRVGNYGQLGVGALGSMTRMPAGASVPYEAEPLKPAEPMGYDPNDPRYRRPR
jgi:hypothetical protein